MNTKKLLEELRNKFIALTPGFFHHSVTISRNAMHYSETHFNIEYNVIMGCYKEENVFGIDNLVSYSSKNPTLKGAIKEVFGKVLNIEGVIKEAAKTPEITTKELKEVFDNL